MPQEQKGGQGQNAPKPQGQGQPQANGGAGRPAPEPAAAQGIREGVAQVGDRLRDGLDTAREGALHGYRKAEGTVARNPGQSLLITFGIGFGVGFLLTQLFKGEEETWSERNIKKPLRDLDLEGSLRKAYKAAPGQLREAGKQASEHASTLAEHAQSLAESIASHLPKSVRKYIG